MTCKPMLVVLQLLLAGAAVLALVLRVGAGHAPEPAATEPPPTGPAAAQAPVAEPPLKLPEWWKRDDPLPLVRTNCMKCHLTAGRELTRPLRDFARSTHDLAGFSCHDCHGGNTNADATAHDAEHGFIGTKLSAHVAACARCHAAKAAVFQKSKHAYDL